MKLIYPACFYPEDNGQYSVIFPDLNGAATYGNSLDDAITMAMDLLGSWILDSVQENEEIPKPSHIKDILLENESGFVSLVNVDLAE